MRVGGEAAATAAGGTAEELAGAHYTAGVEGAVDVRGVEGMRDERLDGLEDGELAVVGRQGFVVASAEARRCVSVGFEAWFGITVWVWVWVWVVWMVSRG